MQKTLNKGKKSNQKTLCIETLSLNDQQDEATDVRSMLEYLFLDVKVRSPNEVRFGLNCR